MPFRTNEEVNDSLLRKAQERWPAINEASTHSQLFRITQDTVKSFLEDSKPAQAETSDGWCHAMAHEVLLVNWLAYHAAFLKTLDQAMKDEMIGEDKRRHVRERLVHGSRISA